ncbi:MAG TPA: ThiF family adenylyltransferase [Bacillota bacterium]|jgi:molybdopterin/thiamine biosynthesis adenylyltransferase
MTVTTIPAFLDRTQRLIIDMSGLKAEQAGLASLDVTVGLATTTEAFATPLVRAITVFALNLLARTFPRVALLPPLGSELLGPLYSEFETRWGFPYAVLGTGEIVPGKACDLMMAIGTVDHVYGARHVVTIGCDGWVAKFAQGPRPGSVSVADSDNPLGGVVAACVGTAQLFARAIEPLMPPASLRRLGGPDSLEWSAYSYLHDGANPALPSPLLVEDLVMIGLGGVGSAAAAIISWVPGLEGSLTLVDPDQVDESNLNRFLIAPKSTVGSAKVEVVKTFLDRRQGMSVIAAPMTYRQFVRQFGRPWDIVVSSVDNEEVRAAIQTDLPRVIIDGATAGPVIGISRHTFTDGACLGCLHPVTEDSYGREIEIAKVLGIPLGDVIDRLSDDRPFSPWELAAIGSRLGLKGIDVSRRKSLRTLWAEDICGRIRLPAGDSSPQIEGSAAFVSSLTGALVAGEVLKEVAMMDHLDNQFMMQAFRGPSIGFPRKRNKAPKCPCYCQKEAMQSSYAQLHNLER